MVDGEKSTDSRSQPLVREEKLKKMRESQTRLKERRKQELAGLQHKVETLENAVKDLRNRESLLLSDFQRMIEVLQEELTHKQLYKILLFTKLRLNEQILLTAVLTTKLLEENNFMKHKILFSNGKFILIDICQKVFRCLNKMIMSDPNSLIRHRCFRYVSVYGISLIASFFEQIKNVCLHNVIPKYWLLHEKALPSGALGVEEILKSLIEFIDPVIVTTGVLSLLLCRYIFATNYGPAIFEDDLKTCISIASKSKFDELYLLDTLDEVICEEDDDLKETS